MRGVFSKRRRASGGFALVIVLWVLAGLTVVAVAVAASVHSNAVSVKLLRDRVAAEKAFLSTSSRIKIIAATALPRSAYLLSERGLLFLDGRPTKVSERESLVMQDDFGLLFLNHPQQQVLRNVLRYCGASEDQLESLVGALEDYVDADDLKRLNGAEAFDYSNSGLPLPRNAELLSREEIWRIKGWDSIRTVWNAKNCDELITIHGESGFNQNTAPLPVLVASGLTQAQATALIDARSAGLPTTKTAAFVQSGPDESSPFSLIAGGRVGQVFRVRHQMASLEWALQYELELTPLEAGGPWRVHEVRIVPPVKPSITAWADLPLVDFLLPEHERAELNAVSNSPFGR